MPAEAERQGIHMMHIDATLGKFLQVLMRACNAKRMATDPRLTTLLIPMSDGMCVGVVS